MFRVTISVNKHDGDGPETFIVGLLQGDTSTSGIHWLFDRTVGKQPLIGGNRGAHFYSVDDTVRNHVCAVQTENIANALYRRILVVLRVFGQQFAARQGIVRTAGHEISKGAATINPELPLLIVFHYLSMT